MDQHPEAATQTEPVVVLSLAQAAILGLISQNGVFGATIAPNGFYVGGAKESPSHPVDDAEYEYADQLIGANGDYLDECLGNGNPSPLARRWRPGPHVKGEGMTSTLSTCVHRLVKSPALREGLQLADPTYRVDLLNKDRSRNSRPSCQSKASGQQAGAQVSERDMGGQKEERHDGKGEVRGGRGIETREEAGILRFGQASHGSGRVAQVDRLDVNVQIDESYCVDVGGGLRRWKCRLCDKSYTSKYNLVTHILGHSGVKPHGCPHCGKLFKQPSHLQTHLLTHQGARPHRCAVCQRAFTQTSHLKRHMLQHSDVKPYSCRYCARGFAYPSELRVHEAKHASHSHSAGHRPVHREATSLQCSQCRRTSTCRSQLQAHLAKHVTMRPYACSDCGSEFAQLHHLKQHTLTHKVTKGFKCDVCSREFTLSANLKRHMLIHTSVRPYQCHVCFKTFVQKQTLKTHMIVHLPVKPFKCKVCGKSFNRMYNLLGHMHLHAGSRPFKCPYCSSKFNLKGNLSRHMKIKHGVMDATAEVLGEEQHRLPDSLHTTSLCAPRSCRFQHL
ncbi:zinc finger protein 710-like [Brienomyrus brachyistius]|uniref:zinc finger protein 710-like n=1 Tax=Brienomyrus brachyistius TaxID=42636 RepID=UPI0020B28AC5|nr:zinc finger protein 710-like [Brienomyrus brachyistius]